MAAENLSPRSEQPAKLAGAFIVKGRIMPVSTQYVEGFTHGKTMDANKFLLETTLLPESPLFPDALNNPVTISDELKEEIVIVDLSSEEKTLLEELQDDTQHGEVSDEASVDPSINEPENQEPPASRRRWRFRLPGSKRAKEKATNQIRTFSRLGIVTSMIKNMIK